MLRLDPLASDPDDALSAGPLDRLSSPSEDPAEASLAAERGGQLRHALLAMAEPYREVVLLRFFGELSLAEIAAQTGRPIPTIKTQLRRGLLRLRLDVTKDGFER